MVVTTAELVDVVATEVVEVVVDVIAVLVVDVDEVGDVVVDFPQDAKIIDITIRQVSGTQRIPLFTYTSNFIYTL